MELIQKFGKTKSKFFFQESIAPSGGGQVSVRKTLLGRFIK